MRELTDYQLVSRFTKGDQDSFVALVERYEMFIRNCLSRCSTSIADEDDVFQHVILRVWLKAHTWQGKSKFSSWLYRLAWNEGCMWWRKFGKARHVDAEEYVNALHQTPQNPERIVINREILKMIAKKQRKLKPHLIRYLNMQLRDGRTGSEIRRLARVRTVSTAKSGVRRARLQLQRRIQHERMIWLAA